jgi:hypothetical protein
VFAPPLLLTVTPGAISVVEDVVPDDVVDVAADGGEPSAVPEASFVAPALGVPVSVAPVDVDEVIDGSALARPGEVTTKTPIPRAAANAPTRPT